MIDELISAALIASMYAVFASVGRQKRIVRLAVVVATCAVVWTVLVARGISPLSFTDVGRGGLICIVATIALSAVVVDGRRIPIIFATLASTYGFLVLLNDRWAPVAAVTLLTSAVTAIAVSVTRVLPEAARTQDDEDKQPPTLDRSVLRDDTINLPSPSTGRSLVAVIASSLVAIVTYQEFADMSSLSEFDADEICFTASLAATGSVLISLALFFEVAWSQGRFTGPLIIFSGVAFAAVGREEAVIPAASLAAAIMLGPLISGTDRLREQADALETNNRGTLP